MSDAIHAVLRSHGVWDEDKQIARDIAQVVREGRNDRDGLRRALERVGARIEADYD